MARGGKRTGAGRKAGGKRWNVLPMPGMPQVDAGAVTPLSDDEQSLAAPPDGLQPDEAEAWKALAPLALRERTLTSSRVPGFRKLCQEWAYCAALEERARQLGITSVEADRVLKRLNEWKKLLRSSLADFSLKSFGKPVAPEKPKVSANPWSGFGKA